MATKLNEDNYFKIDPEAHLVGDHEPFDYFPGARLWWQSIHSITRPMNQGMPQKYLEDVARDFPDLKIIAFHMGYPYCDDLNMIAMAYKNIYVCISLVVTWALSSPYKFAKMLGEAMRWVGPDKIIWGSDDPAMHMQMSFAVQGLRDFKMPEELKEKYGYTDVTDEDKHKIFGENLGKLLGIDTSKRRVKI